MKEKITTFLYGLISQPMIKGIICEILADFVRSRNKNSSRNRVDFFRNF